MITLTPSAVARRIPCGNGDEVDAFSLSCLQKPFFSLSLSSPLYKLHFLPSPDSSTLALPFLFSLPDTIHVTSAF